jgi:hypothetical protein
MSELRIIGRREMIRLPGISKRPVEAKVDTGAYRSCLHVEAVREIEVDGRKMLEAVFMMDEKRRQTCLFEEYRERLVRNSFGDSELRYCVKTVLKIGRRRIKSEVSLANRSGMRYQVLLGRKTIRNKFLVDVGKMYLLRKID